jgi:hypothetical protein
MNLDGEIVGKDNGAGDGVGDDAFPVMAVVYLGILNLILGVLWRVELGKKCFGLTENDGRIGEEVGKKWE